MKKRVLVVDLLLMLLISTLAGLQPIDSAGAESNPVAEPPLMTIFSPENKIYLTNNVTLYFNVSLGRLNSNYDPAFLDRVNLHEVWFKGDWQQNNTYVDQYNNTYADIVKPCKSFTFSSYLTGIPEGNHNITVHATEEVPIPHLLGLWEYYTVSLSVSFAVDTAPPSVSILSPEANGYGTSDMLLSFSVDEATSKIAYDLDDNGNVTIAGNTTLTGLAGGAHTLRVYAWDEAGNVGTSETITFTVEAPFQTASAIAIIVTITIVGVGLLFYFKKRKR